MKIEKKILWAISLSALSLCTYNQPVLASDTDVEILNYVEDQRREARDKEKNKNTSLSINLSILDFKLMSVDVKDYGSNYKSIHTGF